MNLTPGGVLPEQRKMTTSPSTQSGRRKARILVVDDDPGLLRLLTIRLRSENYQVEPADSAATALARISGFRPDLVVSGINGGLNAGINVLYSGTVAAAIEGAFFGITSCAVSLEFDEHANYSVAARLATQVLEQILAKQNGRSELYNINIPTRATRAPGEVHVVPMGLERFGDHFLKRQDPRGRTYYWATGEPAPSTLPTETDLAALRKGHITVTPLRYDLTRHERLGELRDWRLQVEDHPL